MNGKTALITGSAGGIGKRIATELAKRSYGIILNYRTRKDAAERLSCDLKERYGIPVAAVGGDVSSWQGASRLVEAALRHFDSIDILVNNVGPYVAERKKVVDYDFEEWNRIVNGNLNSVFYLSKLIVPQMRRNRWGRIVNIGFERVETAPGWVNRSAYAAAKVGLVSLTKTLALEEAPHRITVNMICPGDIRGEWKEADIARARESGDAIVPIGRKGTGEDIARGIAFLCQEDSDLITGTILTVSGAQDILSRYLTGDPYR
ncbi:MAG: SDR family oxidoreductase [Syntrophobacteraceae bacterium]|nr:SDR family oxidoreductase [Desulfobacteraceae bacterium]